MDMSADKNGFVLRQKWICPKTRKDLSADKNGFVRRQEWIYPHTRLDLSIILSLDLTNSIRPLSIRFHDVVYMLLQHDIMGMCTNTYFAHFWSTLTKLFLPRQTKKNSTSLTACQQGVCVDGHLSKLASLEAILVRNYHPLIHWREWSVELLA